MPFRKRTVEENRQRLREKASQIQDQQHFDQCMELFPAELRDEIYREITPYLRRAFIYKPVGLTP